MTRPFSIGRTMTRYCLPRAAYLPIAMRPVSISTCAQQLVGACAALVGAEVIHLVEITPLDLLGFQELRDVDRVRRRGFERFQLFGLEQHVLIFGELVAFDDLLARHDFAAARRDQLLLDARAVLLVNLIEGQGAPSIPRPSTA